MADRAPDVAIEARVRAYFAAELRQAEIDYPQLSERKPLSRRGTSLLGLAAVVACLVVAVVVLRPWGGILPVTPGGDPLGADGMPLSIGGEPVLRGAGIDARMKESGGPASFLAGGYLILHPTACASASPAPSGGCGEDWRLEDLPDGNGVHSARLDTVTGGAIFVRTSGALTVFRVKSAVDGTSGGGNQNPQPALLIEAVAWRQPTRGPIPDAAAPAHGGEINMALVPDFVGVWGGPTGETIVGYAPKDLLMNPRSTVGGTLENPPQPLPVPVYGEDLTTLVGHMVAGKGFVPVGVDPLTVPNAPTPQQGPSAGPSGPPSPITSGSIVDGFKLGVMAACSAPVGVDAATLDAGCSGYLRRATAVLDAREPGHAALVSVEMYTDGTQPEPIDVTGNAPTPTPAPTAHPGPRITVFVFTLADGSTRATGVACSDSTSCVGVPSYPN